MFLSPSKSLKGVLQGSPFGLLGFLIHVNVIANAVYSDKLLYADDLYIIIEQ